MSLEKCTGDDGFDDAFVAAEDVIIVEMGSKNEADAREPDDAFQAASKHQHCYYCEYSGIDFSLYAPRM